MKPFAASLTAATVVVVAAALAAPISAANSQAIPQSVPMTAAPCVHATPPGSPLQLLSQLLPGWENLGNDVASTIADIINANETLDGTARPTSGLPIGLDDGVLGVVGNAYSGFSVVVDTGLVSTQQLLTSITSLLPTNLVASVDVVASCHSAADLAAAWEAVGEGKWAATMTGPAAIDFDPATETIQVLIDEAGYTAAAATAVEALAPGIVHAQSDTGLSRGTRLVDSPTPGHWGGARIKHTFASGASTSCTAGFTVKRRSTGTRASVTAGHCGSNGHDFQSGQYYYGDMASKTNYPDYDQALLVGSTYAPSIWTDGPGDSEDVRIVKGAADPASGQVICVSGSYLKSLCGLTVLSTNSKFCDDPKDPSTCTTYLLKADKGTSVVMINGDSGGPFYTKPASNSATVRGTVVGASGCTASGCTGYIWGERYLSIAGHLGVDAVIG